MRRVILFLATLGLALALAGCGPRVPAVDPDIRGAAVNPERRNGHVVLLVRAPDGTPYTYDVASVTADSGTDVMRFADDTLSSVSMDDLVSGQTVEVWFDGPVAESYPVQGTAGTILIVDE